MYLIEGVDHVMELLDKVIEAKQYIENQCSIKPELALILGSGLGSLAGEIEGAKVIPYKEVPYFPLSTVPGHAGELVIGQLEGKNVLAMNGRFHFYEGYSMQEVTFPVRVMKMLGINTLIVTNACGGLNPDFQPGLLMFIEDHINFMWNNPLIGKNIEEFGPRFPDVSRAYTPELIELGRRVALEEGIVTRNGVYCAVSGPCYMTRAELRMLRNWGADAVGMSTVPEVIVASHMGMKTLGIACVTDMAIADQLEPISHEIVMDMANKTRPRFIKLVKRIVSEMSL